MQRNRAREIFLTEKNKEIPKQWRNVQMKHELEMKFDVQILKKNSFKKERQKKKKLNFLEKRKWL